MILKTLDQVACLQNFANLKLLSLFMIDDVIVKHVLFFDRVIVSTWPNLTVPGWSLSCSPQGVARLVSPLDWSQMIGNTKQRHLNQSVIWKGDQDVLTVRPVEPVEWHGTHCLCVCICVCVFRVGDKKEKKLQWLQGEAALIIDRWLPGSLSYNVDFYLGEMFVVWPRERRKICC